MADQLSKGARVRWRAGRGSVTGTVERVITGRAKVGSRTVAGSKDDPRYVVKNPETGKTTVLKRDSLTKVGGRAAKPKPAAGARRPARSEAAAPVAKAPPAVPAGASTLRRPSPMRRWMAPAALLAVVAAIVAIVVLAGGDDDGDGDVTVATAPATETTSTATETQAESGSSGPASATLIEALEAEPFEMREIGAIAAQRLGDEQERLEPQFDRTYRDLLAALEETEQAAADGESAEAESISAVATYLTQEVQIEQVITAAFVENSFADGDPATVLSEKTAGTEATLRNQIDAAAGLTAPSVAEDVRDAFAAARQANLGYLVAVGSAIDAGDQAALDQALREGRASAARAGRLLAVAATELQADAELRVASSG
jgi:hypothetical protein